MGRKIIAQCQIMFNKKEFQFAFLISLLYCIISFVEIAVDARGLDVINVPDANDAFCMNDYSRWWGTFTYIFTFLVVLPFSTSYLNDLENGTLNIMFTRFEKKQYFTSKMVACFIGNAIIILIPFLVNLLLCNITFPQNNNFQFGQFGTRNYYAHLTGTNFSIATKYSSEPFIRIFIFSPILFNAVHILLLSFVSGVFGVFLLAISFMMKKYKYFLFVPIYAIYQISITTDVYALSKAGQDSSFSYVNYSIINYFSSFGTPGKSPFYILTILGIMIAFSIMSLYIVSRKDITALEGRR